MMSLPALQVPYEQDEAKWVAIYKKKGMSQLKHKDMMRTHKEPTIKTNLVLPTTQLVAQAKSDMKRGDQSEAEVYVPIKPTPQGVVPHTSTSTGGGNTSSKRKTSSSSSRSTPARAAKQRRVDLNRKQKKEQRRSPQ